MEELPAGGAELDPVVDHSLVFPFLLVLGVFLLIQVGLQLDYLSELTGIGDVVPVDRVGQFVLLERTVE